MLGLTELGYVGIGVADSDRWKEYVSSIIGLELVDEGESDRFYFRADEWHHRFIVHKSHENDCLYTGWRVANRDALEALARRLEAARIDHRIDSKAEAEERHVLGLIKVLDPSGNAVEIFYGPRIDAHKPFHPGRPMYGRFGTKAMGLGHCIIRQDDPVAAYEFYRALGFAGDIEYRMPMPDRSVLDVFFMRINSRQHALGFGPGLSKTRLHHIMLEYTDVKDLGRAYDIATAQKVEIPMPLGIHSNDEMLSFYIVNPSGWMFELGWGGRPALEQQEYYTVDIFGHAARESRMQKQTGR